ncbi:hypothetical protein RND81_01G157600 [Saponaria officinalis]|uniref:Peptidase A1 domain-containing protein n=1 Tax=Saponaria officinalis TaxID=3572 RepID=A0AAW1NJ16_SAPOF
MIKATLIVLEIITFLLSAPCYNTKIPNGLTLKMIHRDSPDSPIYRANLTDKERMEKYIKLSSAKVKSLEIMSVVSKNKSFVSVEPNRAIRPTITKHDDSYMVQVGIGTFGNENPVSKIYYLYLDTGNELIWTQCKAAGDNHFHQVGPLFPESESSSYHPISCDNCPPNSKCEAGVCIVNIKYHVQSRVSAILATEVFTFATEGGHSQSIPNIIFGCGINMQDFPEGKNEHNQISGTLGMGYGFYGLMEQTQMVFGGIFSYCLQPIVRERYSSPMTPMYLRFGNDLLPGPISGLMTMMATSIFRNQHLTPYYLNVEDISVGFRRLKFLPDFFAIKDDGTGGFVIDSDTPEMGYGLCYKRFYNPKTVILPTVTFHFSNNADYVIPTRYVFYKSMSRTLKRNGDMYCMNFFYNDHRSYLGAFHQVDKRIIYDTKHSMLYFAEADCSQVN